MHIHNRTVNNRSRKGKKAENKIFNGPRTDHDALFCLIEWAFFSLSIDMMILRLRSLVSQERFFIVFRVSDWNSISILQSELSFDVLGK